MWCWKRFRNPGSYWPRYHLQWCWDCTHSPLCRFLCWQASSHPLCRSLTGWLVSRGTEGIFQIKHIQTHVMCFSLSVLRGREVQYMSHEEKLLLHLIISYWNVYVSLEFSQILRGNKRNHWRGSVVPPARRCRCSSHVYFLPSVS